MKARGTALAVTLVGLTGCVAGDVQRRPVEPRQDVPSPTQVASPPFAPDASQNRQLNEASSQELASLPLVEGQVVEATPTSLSVRDENGDVFVFDITPETQQIGPVEEGAQVRTFWALEGDRFIAKAIDEADLEGTWTETLPTDFAPRRIPAIEP